MQPATHGKLLTNMAFWQSRLWTGRVSSIYDVSSREPDTLPWWREVWLLFLGRKRAEAILTMGIRESFAYAFLRRISCSRTPQIMTEVFLDPPRPRSIPWRIKTKLQRYLARNTEGILASSRAEIAFYQERFGIPAQKVRYVPLCATLPATDHPTPGDGSILAAGRSQRDYPTFLKAMTDIPAPAVIICGRGDVDHCEIPPQVEIRTEVSRDEYLDGLIRASIVVVPLHPTNRSTGQVVILEAMSQGKTVIATKTAGTVDYIQDGVNGRLVSPGDDRELATAVRACLETPALREQMGRAALDTIRSHHLPDQHARLMLEAIHSLLSTKSSL
ncbi:MAG: glycosyltransferase family 4 protein [Kiritimatiellae bacterium]|nr:glycosyltransferase family 4 protein [Kiritimatiellia bacterium]